MARVRQLRVEQVPEVYNDKQGRWIRCGPAEENCFLAGDHKVLMKWTNACDFLSHGKLRAVDLLSTSKRLRPRRVRFYFEPDTILIGKARKAVRESDRERPTLDEAARDPELRFSRQWLKTHARKGILALGGRTADPKQEWRKIPGGRWGHLVIKAWTFSRAILLEARKKIDAGRRGFLPVPLAAKTWNINGSTIRRAAEDGRLAFEYVVTARGKLEMFVRKKPGQKVSLGYAHEATPQKMRKGKWYITGREASRRFGLPHATTLKWRRRDCQWLLPGEVWDPFVDPETEVWYMPQDLLREIAARMKTARGKQQWGGVGCRPRAPEVIHQNGAKRFPLSFVTNHLELSVSGTYDILRRRPRFMVSKEIREKLVAKLGCDPNPLPTSRPGSSGPRPMTLSEVEFTALCDIMRKPPPKRRRGKPGRSPEQRNLEEKIARDYHTAQCGRKEFVRRRREVEESFSLRQLNSILNRVAALKCIAKRT